jgi:hypothetical protein
MAPWIKKEQQIAIRVRKSGASFGRKADEKSIGGIPFIKTVIRYIPQ